MKGDFSRWTFRPDNHYLRVLMQQGRVQLDADWNEQAAIHIHQLQMLAKALYGPFGGPIDAGFKIGEGFTISQGVYFVDGILCQSYSDNPNVPHTITEQPFLPENEANDPANLNGAFLVYLDVWERDISYIQDDSIRESALGANRPDTALRSQLVWQVKTLDMERISTMLGGDADLSADGIIEHWDEIRQILRSDTHGLLSVRLKHDIRDNRLYRIEIHSVPDESGDGLVTFKWSEENGAVVAPTEAVFSANDKDPETVIQMKSLERDKDRFAFRELNRVEVLDDKVILHGGVGNLRPILTINRDGNSITIDGVPNISTADDYHPFIRRWDHGRRRDPQPDEREKLHTDGAVILTEGKTYELEDGLVIKFIAQNTRRSYTRGRGNYTRDYAHGDYWLIPVRAGKDIDLPAPMQSASRDDTWSLPQPPHGIHHSFAPLALYNPDGETPFTDLRLLYTLFPISSVARNYVMSALRKHLNIENPEDEIRA